MTTAERIAAIRERMRNVALPLQPQPDRDMPRPTLRWIVGQLGHILLLSGECHYGHAGLDEQWADLLTRSPDDLAWVCDEVERMATEAASMASRLRLLTNGPDCAGEHEGDVGRCDCAYPLDQCTYPDCPDVIEGGER